MLLVVTRVLQGFAMGGEYGGAAVYVAEHAQARNRGFLTGWIQVTAALGLVLALAVVLATRLLTGEAAFQEWGWRVPFLASAVLLGLSLWIRLKLSESPVFERMKKAREIARAPIAEAFHVLTAHANPALEAAASRTPVTVFADPADCHVQFDLLGRRTFDSSCDVVRRLLPDAGVPYRNVAAQPGAPARVQVGSHSVSSTPQERDRVRAELREALAAAGYPSSAAAAEIDKFAVLGILVLLMLASTALYGPQAAALVELFPARIRYTALCVPYNIGTGWVGGLLPVTSFAIVAATGNIYSGVVYPLAFTLVSIIATLLFLPETRI